MATCGYFSQVLPPIVMQGSSSSPRGAVESLQAVIAKAAKRRAARVRVRAFIWDLDEEKLVKGFIFYL